MDPERAGANDYGRSLLRAIAAGDRLVRSSLRTDAIEQVAARLDVTVEARSRARPDGVVLTWRAAGLDRALADATMPFFMQWDHPDQYPGTMPVVHDNGARAVTFLAVTPSDVDRFEAWTGGADVPIRIVDRPTPGLWSVGVETDGGELVIAG